MGVLFFEIAFNALLPFNLLSIYFVQNFFPTSWIDISVDQVFFLCIVLCLFLIVSYCPFFSAEFPYCPFFPCTIPCTFRIALFASAEFLGSVLLLFLF